MAVDPRTGHNFLMMMCHYRFTLEASELDDSDDNGERICTGRIHLRPHCTHTIQIPTPESRKKKLYDAVNGILARHPELLGEAGISNASEAGSFAS